VSVKGKRPPARKSSKNAGSRERPLKRRLEETLAQLQMRSRELVEAREQQTATGEILRVISRSPNDVQPVFDSIAASALRLCDAKLCTTFTFDGELIHLVASHHVTEEGAAAYRDACPSRPGRASGTHRAILTRTIVHIPDIREDPEYELRALARANDYGCVLAVPMLRDGHPVGAITVGREAARPFPSEQIELLRTFADQAVIAIENVRLFKELEARNRDLTATSQIPRVISSSPTDVQPVFDTIDTPVEHLELATVLKVSQAVSGEIVLEKLVETLLRTATEHAGAQRGLLILRRGDGLSIEAEGNTSGSSVVVRLREAPVSAAELPESVVRYAARTQESVILDDASARNPFSTDEYIRRQRARSVLCLPLVKQGTLVPCSIWKTTSLQTSLRPAGLLF